MQQTAVDYFIEQMIDYDYSVDENVYLIKIPFWVFKEKKERARALMMEQLKDAYEDGLNAALKSSN